MDDLQKQLKTMRTLVQQMGWGEFMAHVGLLMAEQADKTDTGQSAVLASSSKTIRALRAVWLDCGRFTYPNDMVDMTTDQGEGYVD